MGIIADVNLMQQNGNDYIEIVVPAYPVAISCKGAYYYRSGSTNQKLTGAELESFILRRRGVTWDNMPLPSFRFEDIDDGVVKRFKKWAARKGRINPADLDEPMEVLMERLHLTHAGYLTNAAMLMFSKDPEQWQLGAYTKIGYFESDAELKYQDEIHGSLLDQVDQIIEIAHLKYMKALITYEGVQRIERYFVPDEALREAVLNALYHKDYASGVPIQISIYADKLYIGNCGRLPEPWTVDNLFKKHPSKPYNPNIAHVFYLAGFIESWGRGVEKICSACKENGAPLPEYTVNAEDIMFFFKASDAFKNGIKTGADTENVGINVGIKLTKTESRIVALLAEDCRMTTDMLADAVGVTRRTIDRCISSLKKKGILARHGSNKDGSWVVLNDHL